MYDNNYYWGYNDFKRKEISYYDSLKKLLMKATGQIGQFVGGQKKLLSGYLLARHGPPIVKSPTKTHPYQLLHPPNQTTICYLLHQKAKVILVYRLCNYVTY